MKISLPDNWHQFNIEKGVNCSVRGIYLWTIEGAGVYVGKYTHITRPRREYRRNVERLLNGQPYRKSKPDSFRKIHRELASAVREGRSITLTIHQNCASTEELNARERELIRRLGTLNG